MKIGYACVNTTVGCSSSSTFRLKSFSEERFVETVSRNLECLEKILHFNIDHSIGFFRISSQIIPFASHPVCLFDWRGHFGSSLRTLGDIIRQKDMRISMHPDQFTLLNAIDPGIVKRSISEIIYHVNFLDSLHLDSTAKVQIHIGGVYGDKKSALDRFVSVWKTLDDSVKRRLVIENDDHLYSVEDCLRVHEFTGIPVLFDTLHHSVLNRHESVYEALFACSRTWNLSDGILMVDYSSQNPHRKRGAHIQHIDSGDFRKFIDACQGIDCDIMLEIKDKEKSVLEVMAAEGLGWVG